MLLQIFSQAGLDKSSLGCHSVADATMFAGNVTLLSEVDFPSLHELQHFVPLFGSNSFERDERASWQWSHRLQARWFHPSRHHWNRCLNRSSRPCQAAELHRS